MVLNLAKYAELAQALNAKDAESGFVVICNHNITEFNFGPEQIFRFLNSKIALDKDFLPKLCDYVLDKYNENK